MIFESFRDALEEAAWCAEKEKQKYIIKARHKVYEVMPKYRKGVRRYRHIEVGFRGAVR